MPETVIAYHGDTNLKTALLEQLKWHREQDMIIQGSYGEIDPDLDKWRGCAVGCSIHSFGRIHGVELDPSDHAALARMAGWPEWLCRLEDAVFEGLPVEVALEWPIRLAIAIPVGADLEPVRHRLAIVIQTHNRERVAGLDITPELRAQVMDAINGVIAYHELVLIPCADESSAQSAQSAAQSAAESAWSAQSAAWSAWSARSAQSARSAAQSAAESAESARPAAWSAWSAASAAWSAQSAAQSAAESAESAAQSAAWSESAAESAESAAWSAAWSAEWMQIADALIVLLASATGRCGDGRRDHIRLPRTSDADGVDPWAKEVPF